jgi:hypothetical protein
MLCAVNLNAVCPDDFLMMERKLSFSVSSVPYSIFSVFYLMFIVVEFRLLSHIWWATFMWVEGLAFAQKAVLYVLSFPH